MPAHPAIHICTSSHDWRREESDGEPTRSIGRSSPESEPRPRYCPTQRIVGRPAPVETLRMESMSSGASGAQSCHAAITAPACDHGHEIENRTELLIRWTRKRNEVTIPKLPPPPPRQAQ